MKTIIIISWVVMACALIFLLFARFVAQKKAKQFESEMLDNSGLTLEELQMLLDGKDVK